MSRLNLIRHANTAARGGTTGTPAQPQAPGTDVLQMARDLRDMVELVNPDEFSWQEAHYDRDSRQGRELLFLMANHEWVRATSEIADIMRSDAIETTIKIDVDLSQITHEAFRARTGRIWLPVAVLPPQPDQRHFEPDLFATVTDAAGDPVPMLPTAELQHQISAAMAEIIAKMAVSHFPARANGQQGGHPVKPRTGEAQAADLPGPGADLRQAPKPDPAPRHGPEPPVDTRDERLLLSAAIYRLLRHEVSGISDSPASKPVVQAKRVKVARRTLLGLIGYYIDVLASQVSPDGSIRKVARDPQFNPELTRRAIRVLQGLAESVIVVVLMDYSVAPSVLTVRVPTRKLEVSRPAWIKPWTWILRPCGQIGIDLLLPTSDADRQIQVNLPGGVSLEQPGGADQAPHAQAPHLDIAVHTPLPFQELSASLGQVFAAGKRGWPAPLMHSFADLARVKSAAALDTLRYYEVRPGNGGSAPGDDPTPTAQLRETLKSLTKMLVKPADVDGPVLARLKKKRRVYEAQRRLPLFRLTSAAPLSPQTVVARAGLVENVSQRAIPREATVYVDVTVEDRDYFSVARSSAFMSLVLMLGVLGFLLFWRYVNAKAAPVSPEVLAIVLTLFATIQADRIERPDRATLRGQLFAIGNWLTAASVLPALTLAVALAFQPSRWPAVYWAAGCNIAQILLLTLMWRGPLTPTGRPRLGSRRIFRTEKLNYRHFEALRSDYWRNTTAEALMIGRKAYGYVVWQKADPGQVSESTSPKLRPLLIWNGKPGGADESSSVLALLRSGTLSQAITFVVFRGEPDERWPTAADLDRRPVSFAPVELDPGRLAPADSVASMVDVFVGVHRDEMPGIEKHPLVIILKAATKKLIVLDAQLPVPAPVAGYDDRQWARIRVALRDREDIRRLTRFLGKVSGKMTRPKNERHVVAVQTAQDGRPWVISGPAGSPRSGDPDNQVLMCDLDIVNRAAVRGEGADERTWRVLTICADARSNIESDIVRQLAAVRDHFQLAGLTYALLHGTAVMVLLVHEPKFDSDSGFILGQVAQPEAEHARALELDLQQDRALAKARVLLDKQLNRNELGGESDYPLLRVHFRWQDQPGAFLNVLNSISEELRLELPSLQRQDWSVSYARLQVLTGQVALGQLTIRLHIPPGEIKGWDPARMADMGRKIEMRAADEAAAGRSPGTPGEDLDKQEDPVISIDRIRKPGGARSRK